MPIFLEENVRCARSALREDASHLMTYVARTDFDTSEVGVRIVTCDEPRALKHDVNGLHNFLKSVG
jgi:hypothetical protein